VDPDAASQYAAVSVSRGGGDNLAKVVLQAQSDSGNVATAKTWKFDETGTTTLPGAVVNSTVAKTGGGVGTETAIDLTKSVNKLTNGEYTLADGVEGQIMYLVRQTSAVGASVTVANARVDGTTYTDVLFLPFTETFASGAFTAATDMATLIFTDSAWQSMGGNWNFT
jgi:hypothetical protein